MSHPEVVKRHTTVMPPTMAAIFILSPNHSTVVARMATIVVLRIVAGRLVSRRLRPTHIKFLGAGERGHLRRVRQI